MCVIMSNHVHLIVCLHNRISPCTDALHASLLISDARGDSDTDAVRPYRNLGAVIRGVKSAVTRFARENQIPFSWQPRYHDRIVRNRGEMNRIALYIEQNLIKWEMDCF